MTPNDKILIREVLKNYSLIPCPVTRNILIDDAEKFVEAKQYRKALNKRIKQLENKVEELKDVINNLLLPNIF